MVPPIGLEECHSGAAASEIIHHGFQFPIEQYTPEYYETTIIITSIITTIPVRIWGLIPFSVELAPFLFSFGILAICCALLMKGGFVRGVGFFIVCFFFCSVTFVFLTMNSVGSHIMALFLCMLILYFFYSLCLSGRMAYFYLFSFFAGLGAFVYLSTLMYSSLCVFVLILHLVRDRDFAARVAIKSDQVFWGVRLFIIGFAPNFYFLSKTKFQNIMFLKNIYGRRIETPSDQIAFFKSHLHAFLFQFDNRLWIPAAFLVLFLICGYYVLHLRKQPARFNAYFLLATICIAVIPFLFFTVLLSSKEFTDYYIYNMPLLFMMGGAALSLVIDSLTGAHGKLNYAISLCVPALFCVVFLNHFRPILNFSIKDSHRIYFEDKESAYCYWRFGKAFANYTEYPEDPVDYAKEIMRKCDRFDAEGKRNACYWGWGASLNYPMLDQRAAKVLGDKRTRLLGMSIGSWEQDLNGCTSIPPGSIDYVEDCIVGLIERKLLLLHSTSPGMQKGPLIYFPCMEDFPEYSGLRKKLRRQLKGGTIDSEAGKCEDRYQDVRAIMTGYCSAVDAGENHCRSVCGADDARAVCNFVYDSITQKRQWEKQSALAQ
jgi:hypothetical protein